MKSLDNDKLYWCIEQIDSGRIRRGMDTNSLRALFGESLGFYYEGKAYSILGGERIPAGFQPPPLWRIDFIISQQGIVTDYSLRKAGDK